LRACLVALLAASFMTACAADPTPSPTSTGAGGEATPEFGTFSFALTALGPDALRMTVELYNAPWSAVRSKSGEGLLFSQKCVDLNKDAYTLQNVRAGTGYSLFIRVYGDVPGSSGGCADDAMTFKAYRGGITIDPLRPNDLYFVQPFRLGQFTRLASPSAKKQEDAALKTCANDASCKGIHANATCNVEAGVCQLSNLFPLNAKAPRAFGSAVGLEDGRIALFGGLTGGAGTWTALNANIELFDPATLLFTELESTGIAGLSDGLRYGWIGTTKIGAKKIGAIGGIQTVGFGLTSGAGGGRELTVNLPETNCPGASCNVARSAWRIDLTDAKTPAAAFTSIGQPLAQPVVALVETSAGPRTLVSGGLKLPTMAGLENRSSAAYLCDLASSTPGPSCESQPFEQMVQPRAGATWLCIEDGEGGACKKLLIVGGQPTGKTPAVEIFDAAKKTFSPVSADPVPVSVYGGTMAMAGLVAPFRPFLLGGTTFDLFVGTKQVTGAGNIEPRQILLSESGGTYTAQFKPADLGVFVGPDAGRRLYPTAAALADGSILMIGGLGPDLSVVGDAIVFGPNGDAIARATLETGRFGATAVPLEGDNPLYGGVLVAGGFTAPAKGDIQALSSVEIYLPKPAKK